MKDIMEETRNEWVSHAMNTMTDLDDVEAMTHFYVGYERGYVNGMTRFQFRNNWLSYFNAAFFATMGVILILFILLYGRSM